MADADQNNTLSNDDIPLFNENCAILQEIMKELCDENIKCTHDNIIDKFENANIDKELVEEILHLAVERNLIVSYRYSRQLNYKLSSTISQTAVISDAVNDASTTTDNSYVTTKELNEFKDNLLREIDIITLPPPPPPPVPPQNNQQEGIVEILLKHIDFLQNTISTLVNKFEAPCQPNPLLVNKIPPLSFASSAASIANAPAVAVSAVASTGQQRKPPTSAAGPTTSTAVPTTSMEAPNTPTIAATTTLTPSTPARNFKKKQILIVGDSMLNCIDEKDLRRDAFVRVRNHPGATVEDLIDHSRAHTRHIQHDGVIIMAGTNDISINNTDEHKNKPKIDTIAHMQELVKKLKTSLSDTTHIAICQITARRDKKGIMKDVMDLNQKLRQLAQREQIGFVSTSHFEQAHTGKKGIHPSEEGINIIYDTLEKYVRKISRL